VTLGEWASTKTDLVWIGAIALALTGTLMALSMPSGIYPEIEFPRIVVVARGGDAPPDVVQLSMTRPLEAELATVLGVERIRSRTIRGATELSLQFAAGTDMWRALQFVESRVSEARSTLPPDTEIVVERLTTTSFPILTFNLTGDLDTRALQELGELVIRPALSRVSGVGRVEVLGGDTREVEIILDPARAAALRMGPAEVADKVKNAAVLQAVGRLDDAHSMLTVMLSSEPTALADLAALPIALGPTGSVVPLSALAEVVEGAADRFLRVSGPGGETVLVSVSRLPGASTPELVARVMVAMETIAKTFPAGVTLTPVYDQAQLVDETIRSVRDAILLGIVLCVAVIALFLRDLRGGLVAAIAVPLTLGITFVPAQLLDQSLNLMSLGGLAVAIGLVVDDAIVVIEAIRRRIDAGEDAREAAKHGARELLGPLIGTTATTVVVFLPLVRLQGVVGSFFTALAVMLSSAVIVSLFVALWIVPLAAARWMKPKPVREGGRFVAGYSKLLRALLQRPLIGVAVALLLLVLGAVSAQFIGTGFLPEMDEGAFVLDYFLPAGSSLADTDAAAKKVEAILGKIPDVETYSRRTGAELGPATATLVNTGDIMVRLKPAGQRRSGEEIMAEARDTIAAEVPEIRVEFVQVLQDVLNDLAGTARPIEIKLFGDDYRVLRAKAQEIADRIAGVEGLVDVYPGYEDETPELVYRLDTTAAARLEKSARDVGADLDAALHGVIVAQVRRPDRPIDVRVRYPDAVRFSPAEVANLPVLARDGRLAAMTDIARLERVSAPTELERESQRSVAIVAADHEGRDLGSVVADVRAKLEGLSLPDGYVIELGGQYEEQNRTFRDLAEVMALGLLAVLFVLLAQFQRVRLAFTIIASVPLAVIGALLTLWATGIPLNASSLMGCVLLVGLVVKNGILLLEQAERSLDAGVPLTEALIEAGGVRLRPILMTTLATIAGLLPLALGIGAGSELQRPLSVAVIGGLIVSTAVSLLVLPSLVRLTFRRAAL